MAKGMSNKAENRVSADKIKRAHRSWQRSQEAERRAQILEQRAAEQEAEKAAIEKEARDRTFQEEVAFRVANIKTQKGD